MPENQTESEASTASKKARLKIKKKKEERQPMRGLNNLDNIWKQHMQLLMLRAREQSEKDTFKRELKKKPEKKNKKNKKPLKIPLKIQGRGPSDPKERAAWLRAGNTPYGITRTTPKK